MLETKLSKDDAGITKILISERDYDSSFGFQADTEDRKAFFRLCSAVKQCGNAARANQSRIHRRFKYDGSILTETDLAVSDAILYQLGVLYPDCNIITEEIELHDFSEHARYTFVLDPIDGTDAYSQGLPAWAVAIGILDADRRPCGGIIYAPRFGVGEQELFLCSLPEEKDIYLNGKKHETPKHNNSPKQMVIGSNMMRFVDLKPFKGKLRAFGSSIVHMIAPLVFSNLDCTINPRCFAWDVAASNGILVKSDLDILYINGSEIEYDDEILRERKEVRMPILVGNRGCVKWMQDNLSVL